MMTDVMSKQVCVLCDYDALYAAIELKLGGLSYVHLIRPDCGPAAPASSGHAMGESDLIIVAPVPPISDPMSILARASLLNHVGRVPVLIISEQPSRPESDEMITYLNFPFDMDDLTGIVANILTARHLADQERNQ